jgi:hypothetical protein
LQHTFIIVKEQPTDSFGVSVEVKTESVLLDVWEALQRNTKDTTTRKSLITSSPPNEGVNQPKEGADIIVKAIDNVPHPQNQPSLTPGDSATPTSKDTAERANSDSEPMIAPNEAIPMDSTLENPVTPTETTSSVLPLESNNESLIRSEGTVKEEPSTDLLQTIHHPADEPPVTLEGTTQSPEKATKQEDVATNTSTNVVVIDTPSDSVVSTNPSHDVSAPVSHADTTDSKIARRKRRKRAFFHVMSVMDASKQNAKNPEDDSEKLLRQGDLILAINGVQTCGLAFFQACQLFATNRTLEAEQTNKTDTGGEKILIQCSLVVARRKPKPPPIVAPIMLPKLSRTEEASCRQ